MESNDNTSHTDNNDQKIDTVESSNGHKTITEPIQSDTDSYTEGKSSPQLATLHNSLQPASTTTPIQQHDSPSAQTDGSTGSPTRSKKRAIDTMLDGEEDKECIVIEKPHPPLPKRQTPPSSPTKTKIPSPHAITPLHMSFADTALYTRDDDDYIYAYKLLVTYRQRDEPLDIGEPIQEFFDAWLRETKPNAVFVADALFSLLLEQYDPTTDERLLARIPIIMNQIVQRKYFLRCSH
jgi:hypothetical protein